MFRSLEEINQIKSENDVDYDKKFKKTEIKIYDYKNELDKARYECKELLNKNDKLISTLEENSEKELKLNE